MSNSLRPRGRQHARPRCPSLSPAVCPDSCPLSRWCHPTVSSSVIPFSCLQSFPASGSFSMNQLFTSGGQSIGASASASVLPMNIQYWFPLGLTDLISLQSKGLSRVFSNTTVQKHPFFSVQPSFWPSSHICTGLLENLFSTVKFFHMLLEQTSRIFSSCNTEILYPGNTSSFLSVLGNHLSTFCFYSFDFFGHLMWVETHSICPPVTGFFLLA